LTLFTNYIFTSNVYICIQDRHRASEPVQSLLIEEKPESPDPSGPLDSWLTEPINGAKSPADTPPAPRTPQKQALDPLEPNTDLAEALVPKIRLATDAEADDEGTDEVSVALML
jgi:hypothetical protein